MLALFFPWSPWNLIINKSRLRCCDYVMVHILHVPLPTWKCRGRSEGVWCSGRRFRLWVLPTFPLPRVWVRRCLRWGGACGEAQILHWSFTGMGVGFFICVNFKTWQLRVIDSVVGWLECGVKGSIKCAIGATYFGVPETKYVRCHVGSPDGGIPTVNRTTRLWLETT